MKTSKQILNIICGVLLCAMTSAFLVPIVGAPVAIAMFSLSIVASAVMPKGYAFTLVNPANITWNGKEVREMSEAIFESVYTNPELSQLHQVVDGIVAKQQIVFLGTLSKITKRDAGCGSGLTEKNIPMSEKFWEPEKVKFWLGQCADDLEESFWIWGQNKGIARKDLTDTDFAEFVMIRLETALIEDMLRIVWFNHLDAANVDDSPAGILTSGVDEADYNIIDGLWAQIYDIVAADSTRRVTIANNAEATYANQAFDSTDTTNKVAETVFQDLKYNADYRLRNEKNLMILATQSLVDQYAKELRSRNLDASFVRIEGGYNALMFEGIPIIPFNFWDRTIRADFDSGTAYYQPHRAILTVKENIPVGVDSASEIGKAKIWYEDMEEKTFWKGGYRIDTKVLQSYLIQVAY